VTVGRRAAWLSFWQRGSSADLKTAELGGGIFAVVTTDQAELVEDLGFGFTGSLLITGCDGLKVLFLGNRAHNHLPFLGKVNYESTIGFRFC